MTSAKIEFDSLLQTGRNPKYALDRSLVASFARGRLWSVRTLADFPLCFEHRDFMAGVSRAFISRGIYFNVVTACRLLSPYSPLCQVSQANVHYR